MFLNDSQSHKGLHAEKNRPCCWPESRNCYGTEVRRCHFFQYWFRMWSWPSLLGHSSCPKTMLTCGHMCSFFSAAFLFLLVCIVGRRVSFCSSNVFPSLILVWNTKAEKTRLNWNLLNFNRIIYPSHIHRIEESMIYRNQEDGQKIKNPKNVSRTS